MMTIPRHLRQIPVQSFTRMGRGTTQVTLGWTQSIAFLGHRVIAAGVTTARKGFAFARPPGDMSVVMVSLAGTGQVLMAGHWQDWPVGYAVRMPAAAAHGYCISPGSEPWRIAWVCFRDVADPIVPGVQCSMIQASGEALSHAIVDAANERQVLGDVTMLHLYSALIDGHARRMLQRAPDARLIAVWEAVGKDLAQAWMLGDLMRLSGLRSEALRLACHHAYGRSPLAQVTHLRLEQAATLLAGSQRSVAQIANEVGYENAFAFSSAFKRAWGASPAIWRGKRQGAFIIP